jgi:hypothetical protein
MTSSWESRTSCNDFGAINWKSSYWQQGQPIGLDVIDKGIKDPPAKRDLALRK